LMNICRVSGGPHLWTVPFSSVCFLIEKCCAKSRAPVRVGTALLAGAPSERLVERLQRRASFRTRGAVTL
jgi:hypothetical protein